MVRRAVRVGIGVLVLLLVGSCGMSSVKPYTDYLWYAHDIRHPEVFSTAYSVRAMLFGTSLAIGWAMLYANLSRALGLTLVFVKAPENPAMAALANLIQWIQRRGRNVLWYGAPAIAFFAAVGFSGEWDTYLRWRHAQSFGVKDPMYGLDLGFYVFSLPWYRAVVNGLLSLSVLTTALTIGLYVGLQSLASVAKIELTRPHFRWHVGILVGVTIVLFGLQTWLKTYEAGLIDSGQFTGAGYAMAQGVAAARIFAVLAIVVGLASIFGARVGKPYAIPMAGGIGLAVFYFLGLGIYPTIIQKLLVDPNRLEREAPYAKRAIAMTRYAYGLDAVETRDMEVQKTPTSAEVQAAKVTLDNMRLWDPEVLRQSLERRQAIRPYYTFPDVDLDRYTIGGKETMVMLSPRDINLNGLDVGARNWTNERLRYTHGYGIAVSQVNAASQDGQPDLLASDIPQMIAGDLRLDQPRIYFSDLRTSSGEATDEYAIVHTGEPELDYQLPTKSQTHQWEGGRGIPVGGLLSRIAYSLALEDGNLLVSGNVGGGSRLLLHRNVVDRASMAYPFLKFDKDPYLVLLNGRLIWLLDGYSITDMLPYADRLQGASGALNYIRNSVKVTVDAYSGETTAYAIDPNEPILRAYRGIYPGLVRDLSEAPAGLAAHFRYPEDLFSLQCGRLTSYHVTDPVAFLSNSDAWDIAAERDLSGNKAPMLPYYVQMQLPDEPTSGFMQILPFTPKGRPNMSGWIAAHCDPGQYGKLTLYRFATGDPIAGPELMEGNFTSTPEISNINRQFNNDQSIIVVGNLLVFPIGRSVMYAEPLYLRSRTTGIEAAPRLFRVILALNDKIVVGDSYSEALQKLFEGGEAPATTSGTPTTGGNSAAREALGLLKQADAALRNGDFARFGELQKTLRKRLEEMAK